MKSGVLAGVLIYLYVQRNKSYYLKESKKNGKFHEDCRNRGTVKHYLDIQVKRLI